MKIYGQQLREIITRAEGEIELRNDYGRCWRRLSIAEALALDLERFEGVGNRRRLRFLRLRRQYFNLNGGRTTRRLMGEAGKHIAHPLVVEHRSVPR